ncbi:helix-turn-helix domain-containing protein [Nitratireductor luteus]|uniref:helix-turn-helix domain-containing protein n=1 Tax=Nitratireductor luteus TaxID=2976980 RepID=UPI00223FAA9D|nr:helix-turn-helix domain-containing protein [Nitratireductor luteus]
MTKRKQFKVAGSADFIVGMRSIAAYLGCSERTVRRWVEKHGLPVGHAPDGQCFTTPDLIREWALERMHAQGREPKVRREDIAVPTWRNAAT